MNNTSSRGGTRGGTGRENPYCYTQGRDAGPCVTGAECPAHYDWTEAERIGRATGHVLAQCQACGGRCLVTIYDGSSLRGTARHPWPHCRLCFQPGARVAPIGDLSLVKHRRPGQPRSRRQLKEDLT